MKEGIFDIAARCLLGLVAGGSLVVLVLVGSRALSFNGAAKSTAAPSERIALESAAAKAEKQRQLALEEKVGECHARGGVAKLDPLSGYTGCDLPVPKSRSR
jgi:hypothetical protein